MRTSAIGVLTSTDFSSTSTTATTTDLETSAAVPRVTFDEARENVRAATAELVDALRSFTAEERPVMSAVVAPAVDDTRRPSHHSRGLGSSRTELLAAIGRATAAMHGASARPRVVRTETGVETVSNAGEVSVRAAAAINKLNAALAQVAGLRAMSAEASQQVDQAIRAALALIAAAGIEGITASANANALQIDFAPAKMTESLNRQAGLK